MTEKDYARYRALEARLEEDNELKHLKCRLEAVSGEMDSVLSRLSDEERDTVTEYVGILSEIQQRIVELTCFAE